MLKRAEQQRPAVLAPAARSTSARCAPGRRARRPARASTVRRSRAARPRCSSGSGCAAHRSPRASRRRRCARGRAPGGRRARAACRGSARPGTRRWPACPRPPGRRPPAPARGRPGVMRAPRSVLKARIGREGVEAHHHFVERDAGLRQQHPGAHRPGRVVLVADVELHGGLCRVDSDASAMLARRCAAAPSDRCGIARDARQRMAGPPAQRRARARARRPGAPGPGRGQVRGAIASSAAALMPSAARPGSVPLATLGTASSRGCRATSAARRAAVPSAVACRRPRPRAARSPAARGPTSGPPVCTSSRSV